MKNMIMLVSCFFKAFGYNYKFKLKMFEVQLNDIYMWLWRFFVCLCPVFLFQDEPGKQVRSAIKIKNTSKSHVAFKVDFGFPLLMDYV